MSLVIHELHHIFRSPTGEQRPILDIPSWSLAAGSQVLLRGVSGSGKTTLFNILAGLLRPSKGTVTLNQQSLYALTESQRDPFRARQIGYVFQNHYLLSWLSALENVTMPLAYAKQVPQKHWKDRAISLLDRVGLADYADYRPAQLSAGQRLRVSIARALVNNPPLVLADEPTAALDPDTAETVIALIKTICHENNAMLVLASHDPSLSSHFGQALDLRAGKLLSQEVSA